MIPRNPMRGNSVREVKSVDNSIQVNRKDHESFENFLRRFNKRVQQSGKLVRARKIRFFERPKNKRALRVDAARRLKNRQEREYLKKIGRI